MTKIKTLKTGLKAAAALTVSVGAFGLLAQAITPSRLLPDSALATRKQEQLWNLIASSEYAAGSLPTKRPSAFDLAKLFSCSFLQVTFNHTSDEMPLERKRVIHTYGSVAKVRFETYPTLHSFTGLFQSGGEGLIRLSLAGQGGNTIPGAGLKILIDGHPSENFQIMYSLDGQGDDHNFFANRFSNIVDPPKSAALKLGALSFANAIAGLAHPPENERTLPLERAAAITSDGVRITEWNAPYEIQLWPSDTARNLIPSDDQADFRTRVPALPAGTELYSVIGRSRTGAFYPIGRIVLESRFVASKFGDENLFFQHQSRMP